MSIFSKNLRFLRKRGNHNQEDIALLFKKKANTIGNWENQKSEPAFVELMKLADFFQVSIQDLLQSDLTIREQAQSTGRELSSDGGNDLRSLESYKLQEFLGSPSVATGSDAFWIILRELRALNEKVDLLIAIGESASGVKNSDKSYH
jgi:transcriptional regulator with XRE-family HTH domain